MRDVFRILLYARAESENSCIADASTPSAGPSTLQNFRIMRLVIRALQKTPVSLSRLACISRARITRSPITEDGSPSEGLRRSR